MVANFTRKISFPAPGQRSRTIGNLPVFHAVWPDPASGELVFGIFRPRPHQSVKGLMQAANLPFDEAIVERQP